MDKIIIYTDGACSGNQNNENIGGFGAVLLYKDHKKEVYGGEINTTNNRMEIKACIEALKTLKRKDIPVEVYTDSAYVCNCINQKWYIKWRSNGWINSKKEPVENKELWMELLDLIESLENLKFIKVKGHSGVELNELADSLANKGMDQFR
ncbi:ribonuclease H [Gottschalkia acidurici 9a]|uniref:ribonuclease H n=1 Tax=Gottschalkia acidurici (strain ATCC 7906 / DSM 604 / BCRC 14475 / CIP 104303 / KCTC 5404 / NCIMB 10678 / 9a) TaxID=1128398 RepID=K0B0S9_GOTA9|nr:ribonuclease HI [Gottschalkia acidurici]AFS78251.1 ribonuclease H [Gottschalkia acidurici 9a]